MTFDLKQYLTDPLNQPCVGDLRGIAAALKLAEVHDVPVASPIDFPTIGAGLETPSLDQVLDRLEKHRHWAELKAKGAPSLHMLPSAVVEFQGRFGRTWVTRLGIQPGPSALSNFARSLRAGIEAQDTPPDMVTVQLGPVAWLALGFELFYAKLRPHERPVCSTVSLQGGRLHFGSVLTPAELEPVSACVDLWPFALRAGFVRRDGRTLLSDLFTTKEDEEFNTRRLETGDFEIGTLANCAPKQRKTTDLAANVLARGQALGECWACGPLATSLVAAERMKEAGLSPILIIDRLLPTDANVLRGLSGLGLRNDGPASHITILARTAGLAVLSRVQAECTWPDDGTIVSLSEANGAISLGKLAEQPSPASMIAPRLARDLAIPVALTCSEPRSPMIKGNSIGLCRSEMQILGRPEQADFLAYLSRFPIQGSPPASVAIHLESILDEMVSAAKGALLNYRLIDIDLAEVLERPDSEVGHFDHPLPRGMRGPRWALDSGFYAWQIGMAAKVVANRIKTGVVNVALTLPSAFDISEVLAVRELFNAAIEANPSAAEGLRFGVMIETPRLCAQAARLATAADIFCFGLNDLTASSYGLERNAWDLIGKDNQYASLIAEDPFSDLDPTMVAPMVDDAIERLRSGGATGNIYLCGEPASSPVAQALAVSHPGVFVSVTESDWPRTVLSCARELARHASGTELSRPLAMAQASRFATRADRAIHAGDWGFAKDIALDWFARTVPLQQEPSTRNWKVLKKRLVSAFFGELAGQFYEPGWQPTEVSRYAVTLLSGQDVIRISAFSSDISCHARSEVFDKSWDGKQLATFIESFDREAALHVFPQQHANQLCFRTVYGPDQVLVEAGWGQAMYVFESERGDHPIVIARSNATGTFELDSTLDAPNRIVDGLTAFLGAKSSWLIGVGRSLPWLLGLENFAIEGYFDPLFPETVKIVDIDLPLDIAWNTGRYASPAGLFTP